jgi:amino acid permease
MRMIFAFSTNLILRMLTKQEKFFLEYWEKNREKEKKSLRYVFLGLPFGFIIGIAILLLLSSNWYERAVMVAHSEVNPFIFLIAILSIAVFCGIFYKKYKWERNEQHYRELLQKKKQEDSQAANAAN